MRGVLLVLPMALILVAAMLAGRPARAQDRMPADDLHLGAGSCAAHACHGGLEGRDETWRRAYNVWAKRDKHAKAFDLLTGDLGRRMGERLGIDPAEAPECLSCHGTLPEQRNPNTYDPHDGVSCELCHGAAGGWLGPHAKPEWKDRSAAEKAKTGFVDLTTAEARVGTCVRCHVAGEGRDITHEIMAAGHPPLAFDAASFLRAMPPHWEDEEDPSIATWVAGQRANAAAMLERIARAYETPGGARTTLPDFAVFDCYACHHPVYTGSTYETTRPPGRPGDLVYELSSLEVYLVATGMAAGEHAELLAATARPGAPDELAARARELAARLPVVPTDEVGRAQADRWLANLDAHLGRIAAGEERAPRFELQQIAFAIGSLSANRDADGFRSAFAELDAALEAPVCDAPRCAELARSALAAGR